jgi:hypothetical protein
LKRSGRIFVVTVSHTIFLQTKAPSDHRFSVQSSCEGAAHRFTCPSGEDHALVKMKYKEALAESLNDGDQEGTSRLENNYRYQELDTTGRCFCESVRATWKLIPSGDTGPSYRVLGFCLIEPLEIRTGFNEVDVPRYVAVGNYFRGIEVGTANRRVYKVGHTTGLHNSKNPRRFSHVRARSYSRYMNRYQDNQGRGRNIPGEGGFKQFQH